MACWGRLYHGTPRARSRSRAWYSAGVLAPAAQAQTAAPACEVPPSATSARDVVHGVPGSLLPLLVSYAGRTAIVAGAMYVAGKRDRVWLHAAAGVAVIEAALLLWYGRERARGVDPRACPELPTATHAARLARGDWGALPAVALDVAARAAQLAAGMYLAGSRERTLTYALAGSLGVEAFLFVYPTVLPRPALPTPGAAP